MVAIILLALMGFMFTQSEKKVEDKVIKKADEKSEKSHEIVKPEFSQGKNEVLDAKSKKPVSSQEDPENESENGSVEIKPIWHISDKKMEENEKQVIEKHKKTKRSDGLIYENDDLIGIVNDTQDLSVEETSHKSASSLSEEALLKMEEHYVSKQVHEDREPLEDANFDPEKH